MFPIISQLNGLDEMLFATFELWEQGGSFELYEFLLEAERNGACPGEKKTNTVGKSRGIFCY